MVHRCARRQLRAQATWLGASQVLKQSDCADMLSFAADCSHRLERSSQNILLLRSSDFCAFERQASARLRNSLAFELGMADPHYLLETRVRSQEFPNFSRYSGLHPPAGNS